MNRKNLLLIVAVLVLTLVEIVAWNRFRVAGEEQVGLLIHLAAGGTMALVCSTVLRGFSFATRVTLVLFLVVLTSILPLAGIGVAGLLTILLNTPAGDGKQPEDDLVVGNPPAHQARRESREAKPTLEPLCEAMRSLDEKETERMLHGVKHMAPARKTLHFLRRFRTDPKSSLQFASQAILASESEGRELQVKDLAARIARNPRAVEPRIHMAEVLLTMADWTPEGDSTAMVYRRDALNQLQHALAADKNSARAHVLKARTLLGLQDPAAALAILDELTLRQERSHVSEELRLQALQDMQDYPALRAAATKAAARGQAQFVPFTGDLAEVIAFWADTAPPTAKSSSRPKTAAI